MIVVTAATGQIGQQVVKNLRRDNIPVRALARDAKKLMPLKMLGAEVAETNLTDAAATQKAFQGADAAFLLVPPSYGAENLRAYYNQVGDVYVDAVRAAGIKHVVLLSSIGAELSAGNGPIKGLHDLEQKLQKLPGVNVLFLRPPYFMENFFFSLALIKGQGINGSPIKPDIAFPMIATRDIAKAAAERLAKKDFAGKTVQELHGQRDLSMAEATRIIGQAIEKPGLPYIQFSYEDTYKALTGMGLSGDAANMFNEMYKGFNEGLIRPSQPRGAANTTETSFEAFAALFAAAYQKG